MGKKRIPIPDFSNVNIENNEALKVIFLLLKLLPEYSDNKIWEILHNVYMNYYYAKYFEGIAENVIDNLHFSSTIYFVMELVDPFLKDVPDTILLDPNPSKWTNIMNLTMKKMLNKLKDYMKGAPETLKNHKFDGIYDIDEKLYEDKTLFPIYVKTFLQGISLEDEDIISLNDHISLRNVTFEDFSDRFYEIVELPEETEQFKYLIHTWKFSYIIENWEKIRPKWVYRPNSVLELKKQINLGTFAESFLKIGILPTIFNLYDVLAVRSIHREIYIDLGGENYLRQPIMERMNYLIGREGQKNYEIENNYSNCANVFVGFKLFFGFFFLPLVPL